MRPLAYGKDVMDRRARGERVGLLVVSCHDWESGQWYSSRPEVCRVVLPADVPVNKADWSIALATDVVVCGRCPDDVFYAVCGALAKAGAASLWAEYDDGFWRLEPIRSGWVATGRPIALAKFGAALRQEREVMLALRLGMYGSRVFDGARAAMMARAPQVSEEVAA